MRTRIALSDLHEQGISFTIVTTSIAIRASQEFCIGCVERHRGPADLLTGIHGILRGTCALLILTITQGQAQTGGRVAESRLKADEFSQIAPVPGMGSSLKVAPAQRRAESVAGLWQYGDPILTSFVTKSGGANVGSLLAGALKIDVTDC